VTRRGRRSDSLRLVRASADVVVVGGGIIGCATAAELARAGAQVTLVERREIASAASGRNHGLLFQPQDQRAAPLFAASLTMYEEFAASSPVRLGLDRNPVGFVIAVEDEQGWPAADVEAQGLSARGIRVERLGSSEIRDVEPAITGPCLGGYLVDDGRRVDPAALTLAFALEARDAGADVLTFTQAKQVLLQAGRVAGIATDAGLIRAPIVVDAAGPWAPGLARTAGVDLPIAGARGWLLLVKPEGPLVSKIVATAGWHLVAGDPGPPRIQLGAYAAGALPEHPAVGVLVQPSATGHVLVGGSRFATEREDPEGAEVTREIARRAVTLAPGLAPARVVGMWSGVRPLSPDGLPLIGWVPDVEGLFAATGHGGQGVILGGGTGRLAAQLLLGRPPLTDIAPFAIDRSFERHDLRAP
jgi:glycine/D-amino acid oxidase-like deaminating enzyme